MAQNSDQCLAQYWCKQASFKASSLVLFMSCSCSLMHCVILEVHTYRNARKQKQGFLTKTLILYHFMGAIRGVFIKFLAAVLLILRVLFMFSGFWHTLCGTSLMVKKNNLCFYNLSISPVYLFQTKIRGQ